MSKKLRIGIPICETSNGALGVPKSYIQFIRKFGECVFLDPYHEVIEDLDGILLPGGADVDTKRYEQAPGIMTGRFDPYKEWFDYEFLPQYMALGTPIFCTCRGMQSMWVELGGKLHQDIGLDLNIWDHPTNDDRNHCGAMHSATIEQPWLKKMNYNKSKSSFMVNSRHHQVIDDTMVPSNVTIISRASTDNKKDHTVEAFIHNELPIVAFQQHSEDLDTPFANNLFEYILKTRKSVLTLK